MTNHFSKLTEAEQERLVILMEECAEVIQAGSKVLRHGYESNNKGKLAETNREGLQREIGDLFHAFTRMEVAGDIDRAKIHAHASSKPEHIEPYLHHQC